MLATEIADKYDMCDTPIPGDYFSLTYQGKYLRLQRHTHFRRPRPSYPRKSISDFTKKSRFRMLCAVARIDWDRIGKSSYITLTYPDERVHYDFSRRNRERFVFQRYMEKYLSVQVPIAWRVEWLPRQSGACVGMIAPHIHLMTLGGGHLDNRDVNNWWAAAINWGSYVDTDVEHVNDGEGVGLYIAKYCAKADPSLVLGNLTYLNKTGRHYGFTRKNLVPRPIKTEVKYLPFALVKWLRKAGSSKQGWYDLRYDDGFALLGESAREIGDIILLKLLTQEASVCKMGTIEEPVDGCTRQAG